MNSVEYVNTESFATLCELRTCGSVTYFDILMTYDPFHSVRQAYHIYPECKSRSLKLILGLLSLLFM